MSARILVKFRSDASASTVASAVRAIDARRGRTLPQIGVNVLNVPPSRREAALRRLRASPVVRYAEPDGFVKPAEVVPNDVLWVAQNSSRRAGVDRAWDATRGGEAVKIAILDSGVDLTQPDLKENLLPGRDFFNNDYDPTDDYGHGTQVAGVAAARSGNGVGVAGYCGHCSILPVKITGSNGSAGWAAMAAGITWSADQGARVINISFAGTSGSTAVRDAIAYAHGKGAIVTVSAGNYSSSSPTYPAAYPGALAVASVNGSEALDGYSNYGSWVQMAAPGCNYGTGRVTSSSLFGNFCGTSSAAPALAGIAALAFSYKPSAANSEVESALESTAIPLGGSVRYGRADAWGALRALGATAAPATAPVPEAAPMIVANDGGALAGVPEVGRYLWVSGGGWSGGGPIDLSLQWRRCDSSGACTPIPGATSRSYAPVAADAGLTLRVAVSASNHYGSAVSVSGDSQVVGGDTAPSPSQAPLVNSLPTIAGTPQAQLTLTADPGSWSGSPTAYAYEWQRCGSSGGGCGAIAGARGRTFTPTAADVGSTLRVRVAATNASGSSSAISNATGAVSAPPTAGPVTETFSGSLSSRQPARGFDVGLGGGETTAVLTFGKAASLTLTLLAPDGSTVATASGSSGLKLTRNLPAGGYRYVVSGAGGKGSTNFTLSVTHPAA